MSGARQDTANQIAERPSTPFQLSHAAVQLETGGV